MPKANGRLRRLAESLGCTWVRDVKHGSFYRTPTGSVVLISCSPKNEDDAADHVRKQIRKGST